VLFELARDIGANRAVALARLFLDGLPKGLAAIEAAASSADHAALSRAAHHLKGAVGNFDLPALGTLLDRIETLAEQGPSDALDADLDELPEALDQARSALVAAHDQLDASPSQAAQ
jgi:HPt (histidine-containing phosphotransfer) domain-containing protein